MPVPPVFRFFYKEVTAPGRERPLPAQAGELLRGGVVFLHEPHHFSHQAAFLLKDTRALFVPDRGDTLGDHYMDPKGSALAAGREGAPGGVAAGPTPDGAL